MDLQRATLVSAAMVLGVVGTSDVLAGGGGQSGRSGQGGSQHHGHATGGHTGARLTSPYPAPVFPRAVYLAAPVAYAPYYAPPPMHHSTPLAVRARPPAVYYVPPIDPNAPLFSFNGSAPQPEWNWQRVSLQQLVAEVRAKREAAGKP